MPQLFDIELRTLRRDRAARIGPELFVLERAFADCLDRLALMQRRFDRGLLIGCPDPDWPTRLREFVNDVEVRDPGRLFADAAAGDTIVEDDWTPASDDYDLVLAIGTLDTVNDLPRALTSVFRSLHKESLFLGVVWGGDTLPKLRAAMRVADLRDRDRLASRSPAHRSRGARAAALACRFRHAGSRCRSRPSFLLNDRSPHCRSSKNGRDQRPQRAIAPEPVETSARRGPPMLRRGWRWQPHRRDVRNFALCCVDTGNNPRGLEG